MDKSSRMTVQLDKEFDIRVSTLKSVSVSLSAHIVLLVSQEELLILSTDFGFVIRNIKREASVRSAELSGNGEYVLAHFSDNTLRVYFSRTGRQVANLVNLPETARMFSICWNGNKVIGASNQVLAIWDVKMCKQTLSCRNWKNINCFSSNKTGTKSALGTYNGCIFIVRELGDNKCAQIEFNILKKCIMHMAWLDDKLIAADYDKNILVFYTQSQDRNDNSEVQKSCQYKQFKISFNVREISIVNGKFYLIETKGIHWFEDDTLAGLQGQEWMVCKGTSTKTIFYYLGGGFLKFWTLKFN